MQIFSTLIPYLEVDGRMYRTGLAKTLYVIGYVFVYVAVGLGIAGGWAVVERHHEISRDISERQATANRNHFWSMLAGRERLDAAPAGQLAGNLKPLLKTTDPIQRLSNFYVEDGEFPGINAYMNMKVVPDLGYNRPVYEGRLTLEFVLKAAQATPENVDSILEPLPAVGTPGLYTWGNLAWAVSATSVAGLLALLGSHLIQRRKTGRRLSSPDHPSAK